MKSDRPLTHSLTIPLHSCSHGEGPQPAPGHALGIRCAAGMPGGGLAVARLLLAEGGADVQRIRQRLHGQPGVRLAGSRNAARRVSWGNSGRQTSVIHIHLENHSIPLLSIHADPYPMQAQVRDNGAPRWLSGRHAAGGAFLLALRCGHLSLRQHKLAGPCRGHIAVIRCVYAISTPPSPAITGFNLFCLSLLFFFFSRCLWFCVAEIKLHPGASASNDDHLNYIGGESHVYGRINLSCGVI